MKWLVAKFVIFVQRWECRLHLSGRVVRAVDQLCIWLARPFFGPL